MKKFLAMLISLAMILSLSVSAFAAETDTLYVDIANVADSSKEVYGVWLYVDDAEYNVIVSNQEMIHVSGTIYSYPVADYETASRIEFSVFYSDDTYNTCNIYSFGTDGQNLYTATDGQSGTWSTYDPNQSNISGTETGSNTANKDVIANYTPSGSGASTLPDPIYFDASGIDLGSFAAYFADANYDGIMYDDDTDAFAVTPVEGETNIYSVSPPVNAVQIRFANESGEVGTIWADIPLDGTGNMFVPDGETDEDNFYTGTWSTYTPSGSGEDTTATITGVSIKVGETTYTEGTVTLTPDSGDVTFIVSGTNLKNGTEDNRVKCLSNSAVNMGDATDWNINDDGTEATFTVSNSDFASQTSAFEIGYNNDGSLNFTGTGIYVQYQSEIVSVDITWGAMSFTYDDTVVEGETEETGWTCAEDANKITVANGGNVAVNAAVAYTPADGYSAITGKFQDVSETEVTDADINASSSYDFYLILSGKPEAALDGATIGSVTVTITKAPASVTTLAELTAALAVGGDIRLAADIAWTDSDDANIINKSANIDLNGKTLTVNMLVANGGVTLNVFDGTINSTHAEGCALLNASSTVSVENCTLKATSGTAYIHNMGTSTLKDCTFYGALTAAATASGGTVTLTGTFAWNNNGVNDRYGIIGTYDGAEIICHFDPTDCIYKDSNGDTSSIVTDNGDGTWTVTASEPS